MSKNGFVDKIERVFLTQLMDRLLEYNTPVKWSQLDITSIWEEDPNALSLSDTKDMILEFQSALRDYIEVTEENIAKRAKPTPVKKNPEHFEWFVDYQLNPCEEIHVIARKNSRDSSSVREAIHVVGDLSGIPTRKAIRGNFGRT